MTRTLRIGCGCTALVTMLACSSKSEDTKDSAKSSCEIDTNAMYASLSVQAQGSDTQIFAALLSNGNVRLDCGDVLSATIGGQRTVLVREADSGSGPIHYTAKVPSPASATTATIALERAAPKVSAPLTKVYVPAPFAVRDVVPNVKVSASQDVAFRLDPPIEADVPETKPDTVQLRVQLEGPCLETATFVWAKSGVLFPPLVKADGTVALVNGGQFLKRKGDQASCDVALRVVTFTAGELDPAFKGPVAGGRAAEGSRHEEATFRLEW